MGRPYGIRSDPSSSGPIGWTTFQTVVSVGPPSETTSRPGRLDRRAAGSSGGIRSPLIITSRRPASEGDAVRAGLVVQQRHDLRHRVPHRDPAALAHLKPVRRVGGLVVVRQHERGTDGQRTEHVVDGQIEAERADREQPVARTDTEATGAVRDDVGHAAVADHHTLRRAGRARGGQHVREVVGVRTGDRG
ncbi:hypothetical protein GCM10020000_03180 [Streptomyces olivoverticillatus]